MCPVVILLIILMLIVLIPASYMMGAVRSAALQKNKLK